MTLVGNIYKDFIQKYTIHLNKCLIQEYEIIIVDMDVYQRDHDYNKSVFKINCKKLPNYIKEKIRRYDKNKIIFKHNNLCMIALI